MEPNRN